MTEFLALGYWRQSSWPRGIDDRVLGPGVLMTEFLAQSTDDRVRGPGVLKTEFLA